MGERANHFASCSEAQRVAKEALAQDFESSISTDIAFHMTDWSTDAAFVTALLLFPERFTAEEIREGITDFLHHVPNHLAAAAKLNGFPIQDLFQVGALENADSAAEAEVCGPK